MTDLDMLADLFLKRHPEEAAALLENSDPGDVAELISGLPQDRAVGILSVLSSNMAAGCLAKVKDETAADYLGLVARRSAAAILRRMPQERRDALLQLMSRATRLQLEVVLVQPMHRTGAWMDTSPSTAKEGTTVAAARRRLLKQATPGNELYVVDRDQRLSGVVHLHRLLAAEDVALIESIAEPPTSMLRVNASVENALKDLKWLEVDTLPVVDREDKLVGSIRHAALRKAASEQRNTTQSRDESDYLLMANNLYVGLAEVLATSIARPKSALPPRPEGGNSK